MKALLVFLPVLAMAGETLRGPVAGYVAERHGAQLRTILGVPGAFEFSDPLTLPEGVTRVRPAPGHDFALVEVGDGAGVLHLDRGSAGRVVPVDGMLPADWAAFSATGTAAALFSAPSGMVQVAIGLPDAPRIAMTRDVSDLALRTASVSDDGALVVAASEDAAYFLHREGPPQLDASSTPRDLNSANVTFTAAAGAQLNGLSFTVALSPKAADWFGSAAGAASGGAFSMQIPFNYSGDTSAIGSVSVTLVNSVGLSAPVSGGK